MTTRREFLATAFTMGGFAPHISWAADPPPVTGQVDPNLTAFDAMMTEFVTKNDVPGAALAVTRHGKLVYSRGFGYADAARKKSVAPNDLFRIASISKPITAVAVLQLVEQKKLQLDEPAMRHVKLDPPAGAQVDPRWQTVTIRQCLQHTGGWDRDKSFDPIGIPGKIAAELNTGFPVHAASVVRYMMGKPFDFDPGTRFAYSNLGYLVLGRAIEAVSGEKYGDYVQKHVLKPLGIHNMHLARGLPEHRPKNEVHYFDPKNRTGLCVYPPKVGKTVPLADGVMNVEGFEAHGGWISSAADLVRFASAFDDPARCKVLSAESIKTMWERPAGPAGTDAKGKPRGAYYGCGWEVVLIGDGGKRNTWHGGLLFPGTSTILVRRFDGLNWAVLFNADSNKDGKVLSGLIDALVHGAADAVKQWPDIDLFGKR